MSANGTRAWQPEAALAGFPFLLDSSWEVLQVPFFEGMPERPHWEGVKACLRATTGDVGLTLLGYEIVAMSGGRGWLLGETSKPLAAMVLFLIATQYAG